MSGLGDPAFTALQTPRFRVRRFLAGDLAAFVGYRADPEVARYQSWEDFTEAQGRAFLAQMADLTLNERPFGRIAK